MLTKTQAAAIAVILGALAAFVVAIVGTLALVCERAGG